MEATAVAVAEAPRTGRPSPWKVGRRADVAPVVFERILTGGPLRILDD